MISLAVLASGSGTNLQALIDARRNGQLTADIVAVVTNVADAVAIDRAQRAGIATHVVVTIEDESRNQYDARLAECVRSTGADLVVLAGFMRLLSMSFLRHFPHRVINLHPALPGEFPGVNAIERAFAERDTHGRTQSGVMVHFVPDEGVDDGPVIATRTVPIHPFDTIDTFAQRMHEVEHEVIVSAVQEVVESLSEQSVPRKSLPQ
jgi:phosphoribosylglycinamide formyltransferase 1